MCVRAHACAIAHARAPYTNHAAYGVHKHGAA